MQIDRAEAVRRAKAVLWDDREATLDVAIADAIEQAVAETAVEVFLVVEQCTARIMVSDTEEFEEAAVLQPAYWCGLDRGKVILTEQIKSAIREAFNLTKGGSDKVEDFPNKCGT